MSLAEIWTTNPDQVRGKQIRQIISFAGDGQLREGSLASTELREFLEIIPLEMLQGFAEGCLLETFPDSGLALQDIINEVGRRLDFEVEKGRYRGGKGGAAFDGIWRLDDGRALVVEVKTSDNYRILLDRVGEYRKVLIETGQLPSAGSSILIVVGRAETADLEAQVRGSRHAWDIRLISVRALFKLLNIKIKLENPLVVQQIRSILAPQEYTRVDGIVDLVFLAAEDFAPEAGEPGEEVADGEPGKSNQETVDFNDECVQRIEKKLGRPLVKESRVTWKSPDSSLGLLSKTSRTYTNGKRRRYWFAFPSSRYKILNTVREAYVSFGCGSSNVVFLIPYQQFLGWTEGLHITTMKNGEFYWHIKIHKTASGFQLRRRKGFNSIDLTPYLLASASMLSTITQISPPLDHLKIPPPRVA